VIPAGNYLNKSWLCPSLESKLLRACFLAMCTSSSKHSWFLDTAVAQILGLFSCPLLFLLPGSVPRCLQSSGAVPGEPGSSACLPARVIPLPLALLGRRACTWKGNAELCCTSSCLPRLCLQLMACMLPGLPVLVFLPLTGGAGMAMGVRGGCWSHDGRAMRGTLP